jgi:uncharacterized protein with HEPN domain
MKEKIHKWLYDIKLAIDEIESFFIDRPMSFEEYKDNPLLKRAIERNLEIIGEAINRILKEQPDIKIENAKRIVGLRNQIIHAYNNISDENIWAIVMNNLPKLKSDIESLI